MLLYFILLIAAVPAIVFVYREKRWLQSFAGSREFLTAWQTVRLLFFILVIYQVFSFGLFMAMRRTTMLIAINGVGQIVFMLGGTLLASRTIGIDPKFIFRTKKIRTTPVWLYLTMFPVTVALMGVGTGITGIWVTFLKLFPSVYGNLARAEETIDQSLALAFSANTIAELAIVILCGAFLPAVIEEMLFRGVVQNHLEWGGKHSPRPVFAALLSALLFGLAHGRFLDLPSLVVMGILLSWLATRTQTLLVGSALHFMNNALLAMLLYVALHYKLPQEWNVFIQTNDYFALWPSVAILLASGLLLASLLYVVNRFAPRYEIDIPPSYLEQVDVTDIPLAANA